MLTVRENALGLVNQLGNLAGLGLPGVPLPSGDLELLRAGIAKALAYADSKSADGMVITGIGIVYGAASNGVLRSYNFVGYATPGSASNPGVRWQAVIKTPDRQWSRKGPQGAIPVGDRYVVARTETETEYRSGQASYWTRKLQVFVYTAAQEVASGGGGGLVWRPGTAPRPDY